MHDPVAADPADVNAFLAIAEQSLGPIGAPAIDEMHRLRWIAHAVDPEAERPVVFPSLFAMGSQHGIDAREFLLNGAEELTAGGAQCFRSVEESE
jgi:hypothetical protein